MSNFNSIDDQLDRLVDERQISYSQAYDALYLPKPPSAPVSADAIEARLRDQDYYTQEFRLTGPDNRTPEEVDAQKEINKVGRAAVEAALAESKKETK